MTLAWRWWPLAISTQTSTILHANCSTNSFVVGFSTFFLFSLFFLFKCLKWEKGNLCCSEFREEKNVENENYSGSTWANRSQCKEIDARLWSKFNFESDRAVRRFRGLSDLQWILELNFVTLNNPKNKRQNWPIRKL